MEKTKRCKTYIIVSHILSSSAIGKIQLVSAGDRVKTIQGNKIHSLEDVRRSFTQLVNTGIKKRHNRKKTQKKNNFITLELLGQRNKSNDTLPKQVVISLDKAMEEEPLLAEKYQYKPTQIYHLLHKKYSPAKNTKKKTN